MIVPANLLPQWQDEIERHMADGAFAWGIYEGTGGGADAAQLTAAAQFQVRHTLN